MKLSTTAPAVSYSIVNTTSNMLHHEDVSTTMAAMKGGVANGGVAKGGVTEDGFTEDQYIVCASILTITAILGMAFNGSAIYTFYR